jgi:Transglutaminase-like superfamily
MPTNRRRLSRFERVRVVAEVAATYCSARWWLFRLTFPEALAAARDVRATRPAGDEIELRSTGLRLGRAVERTLRKLPVDSRCLVTALVLTRMLARRGIDSTFVLGVRANPSFGAHAWVERNGVALLPTTYAFTRLSEL